MNHSNYKGLTRREVISKAGSGLLVALLASKVSAASGLLKSTSGFHLEHAPDSNPGIITTNTTDGRTVKVTVWHGRGKKKGLILFSHGLGSSPDKYNRLMKPWSDAGYDILAPMHVDSADHPDRDKYKQEESWPTRLHDMKAVAALYPQERFIAAGHSYGGMVALTLGGATPLYPPGFTGKMDDPNAIASLALSPPGPIPVLLPAEAYNTISVPAFIQTGTLDVFQPDGPPWQSHLTAYEHAPVGDKYALVLDGVDHGFGGLIYNLEKKGNSQEDQLQILIQQSQLFIDGYGAGSNAAKLKLRKMIGKNGLADLSCK